MIKITISRRRKILRKNFHFVFGVFPGTTNSCKQNTLRLKPNANFAKDVLKYPMSGSLRFKPK